MIDASQVTLLPDEPSSSADNEPGIGALATARGCLPLTSLVVRARICGLTVETTIQQTFVNSLADELLEATYLFPLPDRAAVTSFRLEVADRVVEGAVRERAAAREEYAQAIREGHRAAIAEENRPDIFSMRVGNLPPRETAKVTLTLVGPLEYADGQATFRFPLVVAPRYIPGAPIGGPQAGPGVEPDTDQVPDASCISPPVLLPGFRSPVRLAVEVEIDPAGFEIANLGSSLHAVLDETASGGVRRVKLVPGERINRDFLLRFAVSETRIKSAAVLAPDETGDEGTFLLTIVPPAITATSDRPRDVVLLLDRSGSMKGWKMVAARRAAARMIDTLTTNDRFAVFAFDQWVDAPTVQVNDRLLEATDRHRFRAVEFLSRLDARGGTEMAEALGRGTQALLQGDPSRDRVLVLVTDGQVVNEDHLLATVSQQCREMRIFTVGIDKAVNAGFLRRLAAVGGGACDLIESEERLDEVMDKIHGRISPPLLTGIQIRAEGTQIDKGSLTPPRHSDLHMGVPLVVSGRCRAQGPAAFFVSGKSAAGETWSMRVTAQATKGRATGAIWARARIRDLEDQYAAGSRDAQSLEKAIVAVSLHWQVLSRFTAFVAVDRAAKVEIEQPRREIVQPVEMPEGWDANNARFCLPAPEIMSLRKKSMPAPGGSAPMRGRLADPTQAGGAYFLMQPCESHLQELSPEFELAAYRCRAAAWLEDAAACQLRDAKMEFVRQLAGRLKELIDDLVSVGADDLTIKPLRELLAAIQQASAAAALSDDQLAQSWASIEQALAAFSGTSRPREFWKQDEKTKNPSGAKK